MRTILLAAMLTGQATGEEAPPLRPVRPWNIEYADNMCVAARAFGDAKAPIVIAFKPTPFSDILQTVVFGTRDQLGKQAQVNVTLEVSGRDFGEKFDGTRVHLPKQDRAAVSFYVSRDQMESLVGAPALILRASGGPAISVQLAMGKAVLAGLKTFETDLLVHFGYDPAKIAAIVTPARSASPALWITHDDYPGSALSAGKEGTSYIGWTISTEGRVTDCRILQSSGTPALDQAACAAITKRGRAKPALDAAGKPVESYSTRLVRWLLPR